MTADWTTCRVVRDRLGGLMGRRGDTWLGLNRLGLHDFTRAEMDDYAREYGPLIPVLDADGLPVVASQPAVTQWQPVEPGTVIKAGTWVREEWADGQATEWVAIDECRAGRSDPNRPRVFIDPRTVPADPDADLVEAIGAVLTCYEGDKWESFSVAILAAIRETHTIEPKPAAGPLEGARGRVLPWRCRQ